MSSVPLKSNNKLSLLNRVGCVVTSVTWVGVLLGSMGGLRGSDFYVGCVGYVRQNIFYVGHNFYVGCVGQIFLLGLRGSKYFAWVNFFLRGSAFIY